MVLQSTGIQAAPDMLPRVVERAIGPHLQQTFTLRHDERHIG